MRRVVLAGKVQQHRDGLADLAENDGVDIAPGLGDSAGGHGQQMLQLVSHVARQARFPVGARASSVMPSPLAARDCRADRRSIRKMTSKLSSRPPVGPQQRRPGLVASSDDRWMSRTYRFTLHGDR